MEQKEEVKRNIKCQMPEKKEQCTWADGIAKKTHEVQVWRCPEGEVRWKGEVCIGHSTLCSDYILCGVVSKLRF